MLPRLLWAGEERSILIYSHQPTRCAVLPNCPIVSMASPAFGFIRPKNGFGSFKRRP